MIVFHDWRHYLAGTKHCGYAQHMATIGIAGAGFSGAACAGCPRMSSSISIIIPTFDVADYIEPCIKSLQAQTFADFDVVIVNDGSTDDSADLARQTTAGDDRFHRH